MHINQTFVLVYNFEQELIHEQNNANIICKRQTNESSKPSGSSSPAEKMHYLAIRHSAIQWEANRAQFTYGNIVNGRRTLFAIVLKNLDTHSRPPPSLPPLPFPREFQELLHAPAKNRRFLARTAERIFCSQGRDARHLFVAYKSDNNSRLKTHTYIMLKNSFDRSSIRVENRWKILENSPRWRFWPVKPASNESDQQQYQHKQQVLLIHRHLQGRHYVYTTLRGTKSVSGPTYAHTNVTTEFALFRYTHELMLIHPERLISRTTYTLDKIATTKGRESINTRPRTTFQASTPDRRRNASTAISARTSAVRSPPTGRSWPKNLDSHSERAD